MSDFFSKLQPIIDSAQSLQQNHLTVYIHCSKLNSLIQTIKLIPNLIENEKKNSIPTSEKKSPKRSINFKNRNSISNIQNAIEQVQSMANECLKETCVQYLLNNPIKTARKEIQSFRETLHNNFELLKFNNIAARFKISKDELADQDLVDMKRISQILTQLSLKGRTDITDKIAQRFKSLRKIGIESELGEKQVLTIPDLQLPTNVNLVLEHEDVRLGKEIGRGQSGSVHIGYIHRPKNSDNTNDDKANDEIEVAVKVLFRRALTTPELESFQREIYALSILVHPKLLKFYGYTENPPFYIVTEYMPNGSVFTALRNEPEKLTPTKRTLIAFDVAKGIEFLHQRNIIHRDLKSLNVLLDSDYRAKICDFGMARLNSNDPKTGLIGTVHWMAPEVLMSSPTYDSKVDVYSFGIFLWELLTGDMPYQDKKPHEIIAMVTDGDRPPLPDNVPPKLRDLITKCWSQNTNERPTMSSVVTSLVDRNSHFPGTDEAEFQLATGIPVVNQHRVTKSMTTETHKRSKLYSQQRFNPADRGSFKLNFRNNNNDDDGLGIDIDELNAAAAESIIESQKNSKQSTIPLNNNELKDSFAISSDKSGGESSISFSNTNDESSEPEKIQKTAGNELKLMDTAALVDLVRRTKDKETQNNALELLFRKITISKRENDIALKNGLCTVVSQILDERSPSSNNMLRLLAKLPTTGECTRIFDINVLKSLLRYSELEDASAEEMRSRALSVLISASSRQIDFLKGSPSFITQLLSFIEKPPSNQPLCKSLLQLIRQMLSGTSIFPGITVMQLLFSAKLSLLEPLKPIVIDCIKILVTKFKEGKEQMTREMMIECIKDINSCQSILDGYVSDIVAPSESNPNDSDLTQEDSTDDETKSSKKKKSKKKKSKKEKKKKNPVIKYTNDGLLISLLFTAKSSESAFSFLVKIAEKKRFATKIAKKLPIGLEPEIAVSLYRPLFSNKKCLQYLSEEQEFYSILAFLVGNHEYGVAYQVLKSLDTISKDFVNHTPLCRLITEAINNSGSTSQLQLSNSISSENNGMSENDDNGGMKISKTGKPHKSTSKLVHKSKTKKSGKDKKDKKSKDKDKDKDKDSSYEIEDDDNYSNSNTGNELTNSPSSALIAQNEDDEIMLMGCVYSLSKNDFYFYEFNDLFPKIWNTLINGPSSLKLPSFLAVTSIACFNLQCVDVKLLFNMCAKFVSYNSSITREVSYKFIRIHSVDDKIDFVDAIQIFIENYEQFGDEIDRDTIKIFLDAANKSDDQKMLPLKEKLQELWSQLPSRIE